MYRELIIYFKSKFIHMGKGDIKTRRGKIVNGSYGRTRPRKIYRYVDDVEVVDVKESKKK